MASSSEKILERLINDNLFSYLKSISLDGLRDTCLKLRLGEEQIKFLLRMFPVAQDKSESEFISVLEIASKDNIGLYPIQIDPDSLHVSSALPYADLLRGKRLVLVGPSLSILGKRQGDLIESYDLVIRMNFQWPIASILIPDIGKRMDVLYHCCNGDYPIEGIFTESFSNTKFVCYERNIDGRVLRRYCDSHDIKCLDVTEVYKSLGEKFNFPPNTGTVAISHLLQFDFAELFITGISLFQEPYYDGYKGDGADRSHWIGGKSPSRIHEHQFEPQIAYCRDLILGDARIRIDDKLRDVFNCLTVAGLL